MADGTITIATKLDTKSFDKQIEQLKAKSTDLEVTLSKKKELGLSSREIKEVEVELEKTKNKIIQLRQQEDKLNQSKAFENVNKSLKKAVQNTSRLILGIFGIRSAYMFLRQTSSELASYDKQYAANLEYIRYVLAQAIAPVLRWIVNLAGQVLQIVGMIVNALFGVNIFSNASAKSFQKMKAGAGGVSKAVKEIKKQLAGFDELNVLQSQDTSTGGGGAGGVSMPSFDLSKAFGEEPWWIAWIKANRELILGFLAGIITFLTLIQFGLSAIKALGIGLMVWGVVTAVLSLLEYLKNPTWENFGKIIQGIGIAIIGLGVLIGGPAGLVAIIAGAIITILGLIASNWEKIKGILDKAIEFINNGILNIQKWFVDNIDKIYQKWGWLGVGVTAVVVGLVSTVLGVVSGLIKTIKQLLDGLFTGVKQILDGIIKIFRGNFKEGIISIAKGLANILIGIVNGVTSGINTILWPIRQLIVAGGKVTGKNWTMDNIQIPQIPLLKVGGIINMPNNGVMLGSAIGGEAGAEGVIPLTDSQAMETLGEAIGRYITINANITNTMNGKVISRQLQQIQNSKDFAYNS